MFIESFSETGIYKRRIKQCFFIKKKKKRKDSKRHQREAPEVGEGSNKEELLF